MAMPTLSFEQFELQARAQGFDEVLERIWAPGVQLDTHTHPFAVNAVVIQGEMWLTEGGQTRHLKPGDTFELEHEVPHSERYGPLGATYWVARRSHDVQAPLSRPAGEGN
jgi:mannose-6-phosphate isomerase-like protein (cupin superfamily)